MKGIPEPSHNLGKSKYDTQKKGKKGPDRVLAGLIIIIVAIVLYSGVSYWNESQNELENNEPVIIEDDEDLSNITNDTSIVEGSEEYILGVAIVSKDVAMCEELETKKQDCYEALADDSEEACIKVEDYEKKKECVLAWVEEKQSTLLCSQLNESDQDECGLLVDPCYGLLSGEREICLALAYEDYGYCGDENCLFEYAKESKDGTVCETFDSPSEAYACYSLAEDSNKCKNLVLTMQQDYCYYLYGTIKEASYYCDEISEDSTYNYMCNYHFAIEEEDLTFCEKIGNNNDIWECYKNYAMAFEDIAGCEQIDPLAEANFESCYFNFAVEYSMPEYCVNLSKPSSRDSCYGQSIMDDSKPLPLENCENIQDSDWKDMCYRYSAEKNEDITICEYIVNENKKIICLDHFEETEEENVEEENGE